MALYKLERTLSAGRGKKIHVGSTTGPSQYATGGFSYSTGLNNIDAVIVAATGGYEAVYNTSTSKIMAYYGDYSSASDGPLTEVAASTDLSSVTFYVIAVGD